MSKKIARRQWSGMRGELDKVRSGFSIRIDLIDDHPPLAMTAFKSGPPGGKTIPPTPVILSDLVGGVYGPGSSVASTGFNSQRPVVKAATSRAAGDTWEDVLEYYMVRL